MTSPTLLEGFVYGTPGQLSALGSVRTMEELFDRIRKDARRYTAKQPPERDALYKRHVLHFLNHRCRGVHIDLPKLMRERVVRVSGEYPNQTLSLVRRVPSTAPSSYVAPNWTCLYNNGHSEDVALELAIKASASEVITERCPLSDMPLKDPVSTIHGRVYERSAIEAWFRHHQTDPMTGERLLTTALF